MKMTFKEGLVAVVALAMSACGSAEVAEPEIPVDPCRVAISGEYDRCKSKADLGLIYCSEDLRDLYHDAANQRDIAFEACEFLEDPRKCQYDAQMEYKDAIDTASKADAECKGKVRQERRDCHSRTEDAYQKCREEDLK